MADSRQAKVSFGKRFVQALGDRSLGWLKRETGIAVSTLSGYRSGSMPSADVGVRLADAMGVDIRWLIAGAGAPNREGEDAFELLPRYAVQAAAGGGLVATDEDEDVIDTIAFRRQWLSRMGINTRSAGLITAEGDSMEPTIPDGAILLIDRSIADVRDGFIYVLVREGALLVKRIQTKMDGSVVLISDNPMYERETIAVAEVDQLVIVGRVLWAGHQI